MRAFTLSLKKLSKNRRVSRIESFSTEDWSDQEGGGPSNGTSHEKCSKRESYFGPGGQGSPGERKIFSISLCKIGEFKSLQVVTAKENVRH